MVFHFSYTERVQESGATSVRNIGPDLGPTCCGFLKMPEFFEPPSSSDFGFDFALDLSPD